MSMFKKFTKFARSKIHAEMKDVPPNDPNPDKYEKPNIPPWVEELYAKGWDLSEYFTWSRDEITEEPCFRIWLSVDEPIDKSLHQESQGVIVEACNDIESEQEEDLFELPVDLSSPDTECFPQSIMTNELITGRPTCGIPLGLESALNRLHFGALPFSDIPSSFEPDNNIPGSDANVKTHGGPVSISKSLEQMELPYDIAILSGTILRVHKGYHALGLPSDFVPSVSESHRLNMEIDNLPIHFSGRNPLVASTRSLVLSS